MTSDGLGAQTGNKIMLAPLATLAFLIALWLVSFVTSDLFGQSRAKILAALHGRSMLSAAMATPRVVVRISSRGRPPRTLHAQPELRVAA
jgi:hypothetical protein